MEKRLYRSKGDRMIWGICGGIGKHYNTDPTIIRIIWAVLGLLFFGLGFWIYVILRFVIPLEPE